MLNSAYILKVKLTAFAEGLNGNGNRKTGVKYDIYGFDLANEKIAVAVH